MRNTLLAIATIFMISIPQILGARTWERKSRKIKNNKEGIKSHGKRNKNSQAISHVNGKAYVSNTNNLNNDNNNVVQIGDSKNKVDSNAVANNHGDIDYISASAPQYIPTTQYTSIPQYTPPSIQYIATPIYPEVPQYTKIVENAIPQYTKSAQYPTATYLIEEKMTGYDSDYGEYDSDYDYDGEDKYNLDGRYGIHDNYGNNLQHTQNYGKENKNAKTISSVNVNKSVRSNKVKYGDYSNHMQIKEVKNKISSQAIADSSNNGQYGQESEYPRDHRYITTPEYYHPMEFIEENGYYNMGRSIDNNSKQGIKSYGRKNKNAEAISHVNAKANVANTNNIAGNYNNVVQIGKSKNKVDSDAFAKNKGNAMKAQSKEYLTKYFVEQKRLNFLFE